MTNFSTSISIAAPPARVWQVLTEVEQWPEWTPSMQKLERLDPQPFGEGSRVRIQQPKLQPAIWTVTKCEPGKAFVWVSQNPGIVVAGLHSIEPIPEGSKVTLSVRFNGFLAPLVCLLTANLTRKYLGLEAAGLKARCEGPG